MNRRIIVALDYAETKAALACAVQLDPASCRVKVGKELFTAAGPAVVEDLMRLGFEVFLDLKFHDIPHTVAGACAAATRLGVWMVDVHALGGRAMLEAARAAVDRHSAPRTKIVAVTVLTSIKASELAELGIDAGVDELVMKLARLAQSCGLDGVVCSAREATSLRRQCGNEFCLVTPGIRPAHAPLHDQARVLTASAAIAAGANYLVIGRLITEAADPRAALEAISREISADMRSLA